MIIGGKLEVFLYPRKQAELPESVHTCACAPPLFVTMFGWQKSNRTVLLPLNNKMLVSAWSPLCGAALSNLKIWRHCFLTDNFLKSNFSSTVDTTEPLKVASPNNQYIFFLLT